MYHCLSHHRPLLRPRFTSTMSASCLPMQPSSGHSSSSHTVHDHITLDETERDLLGTLLEATKAEGSGTVLRCAGGWVRDKLLGKTSLDIDIALDNMMGKDFAELVNRHLASLGRETRHAAVIQSNPDQSKHLETARMKIGGLWIDLVNLRSETYAQDSRIPTMQFGTPEQDAMRRDFTINSLFYNINESRVEDLTHKGLEDLRLGILRTPLAPMETFMDDPLRVLRAVRFGTRFGFELEASLVEAASSQRVREALAAKVSRERFGSELEGMFTGPAPVAAMQLLVTLGIFDTVFALPAEPSSSPSFGPLGCGFMDTADRVFSRLVCSGSVDDPAPQGPLGEDVAEEKRLLLLTSLLLPLRSRVVQGLKGKASPASVFAIRESIKWKAKDAENTVLIHEAAEALQIIYPLLSVSGSSEVSGGRPVQVSLGLIVRKLKQNWRIGIILASLLIHDTKLGSSPHTPPSPLSDKCLEMARGILSTVSAFGLDECWSWKPLLDGKQVMSILGWSKAGPELGQVLNDVIVWQLMNPQGDEGTCREFIKTKWIKT